MLKYLSQGVLLSWIGFVVYKYFEYHPEYEKAYKASPKIFITFFITFLVAYGCFFLYESYFNDKDKIKVKKSPFSFVLIGFFGVLLVSTILFSKTGVGKSGISYFSVIASVLGKMFPVVVTLGGTFILSFLIGSTLSRILKIEWIETKKGIVNIVFGLSIISLILLFLGWAHLLYKPYVLGTAFILLLLCINSYGDFIDWFFAKNKEKEEINFLSIDTFLYIVLFFFIAINFFDVMRPMPIGWDDMGVYLNMPQRIAENGAALSGRAGQAYMLLSSLGFILWPKYIGDMVGLYYSWFGGLLAIMAVYVFVKRFFTAKMALFACVYYYLMPMITFQSALDLKMDPPLFLFMVTSALIFFDKSTGILSKIRDISHKISLEDRIKMGVGGMILATAFFIKITTSMEIFAFIALVVFYVFNWKTALGIIFIEIAIFFGSGFSKVTEFSDLFVKILIITFVFAGIFTLLISKVKKHQLIHLRNIAISVGIGFFIVFLPWATFNVSDSKSLSLNGIVKGQMPNQPRFNYELLGIDKDGKDKQYCEKSGGREELGRYIGYEQPFIQKYFTLPWKNTMNTQTRGYYLDIGFLYLAIIPGLFLLGFWRKWGKKEWGIVVLFSVNWFFWTFAGQGVPWYGLFGFLPAIVMVGMFLYNKELEKSYLRYVSLGLILITFTSFCFLRETKTGNGATIKYAFGLQTAEQTVDSIVPTYRDTSKMIAGDISQEEYSALLEKYMIPFYKEQIKKQKPEISDEEFELTIESYRKNIANFKIPIRTKENPAYFYRIGTFIPYFVKNFRKVVLADAQLDRFRCIDGDGTDDKRTLQRLKDLGVKYFVFDTNTATIEKDPNGTLHKKVRRFIDFANKNLKVIYYRPKNGIAFMML